MKLGFSIAALVALIALTPSPRADEIRLDDVVARAKQDVIVRSALEDNALLDLVQGALREASGADVSLAFPFPTGTRVDAGAITVREALAWVRRDDRIGVVEMTVAELREVLEHGAAGLATYGWEDGRPLIAASGAESLLVAADGVSYEIDLTAPAGQRIVHFAWHGAEPAPDRKLRVAGATSTLAALGRPSAVEASAPRVQDAVLARLRAAGSLGAATDHSWSVLPDYATTPERPLIDRLVRAGVAPREEVMRLFPDQPARRGDLAYWLSRAFGWRETKLSGAYSDVPDSLEPWIDGLVKRRVVGAVATEEYFQPFAAARLPMVLDWCENSARVEHYALDVEPERDQFRRSLLTGTSLISRGRPVARDTVSRAQLLGMIANVRFPVVRVIETADFHGAMEPVLGGRRPRAGSAALAAAVQALRAENPEGTVLLDGGDAFQGTMISNLSYGRAMVEQMNWLGYAAMAIGNHEFDWSIDTLARRIDEMRFPALAANLSEAASGRRPRWALSDTVFHRRGVRIGVFGLAFPGTPTATLPRNVATLRFADDSTTAAPLPARLRARGAEVVIGLGHIPGTIDSAGVVGGSLARVARIPGVDVWLGGHSHTWIDGAVRGIPTLIPGSHGEGVAVCDLVVDPSKRRVIERHPRLVLVGADPHADSTIAALVTRWGRDVEHEARIPIGVCSLRLGKQRGGESAIGSLVADVIRSRTGADVALQNNGGLRAELPEGEVTRGAIYEVIPFENTIVTVDLTGAEIRQVLEESLTAERVIQVSGLRYRFDLGRPAGSRVTSLNDVADRPLDPQRVFRVACNDFMADGGDDLVTLAGARARVDTEIGLREALEEGVRERAATAGGLRYETDGRVTREPGSRPPARGD